jgi:hypothetical protein
MPEINLLHTIRNSVYCRQTIFPALWSSHLERIPEIVHDDFEVEAMDLKTTHVQFEFVITQEYIRRKFFRVFKIVRQGILFSGNLIMQDWKASFDSVTEIRSYVEEVLLEMVSVHQELASCGVAKERATRILNSLVDQLFLLFFKCVQEMENISPAYCLQLLAELDFVSTVLNKNLSESSKNIYVKAISFMEEICEEETQEIRDALVEKTTEQTCMIFKSFGIRPSQRLAEIQKDDDTKEEIM